MCRKLGVILLLSCTLDFSEASAKENSIKVICYTKYLSGKFIARDKDASMCTDVIYSGAKIVEDQITMPISMELYTNGVPSLAGKGISAKIELEISLSQTRTMGKNSTTLRDWISTISSFLLNNSFDGMELVWECWKDSCKDKTELDTDTFLRFADELRTATKLKGWTLSLALPATLKNPVHNIELLRSFDWITLRSDDTYLTREPRARTYLTSFMQNSSEPASLVDFWTTQNISRDNLIIGLAFTGFKVIADEPVPNYPFAQQNLTEVIFQVFLLPFSKLCNETESDGWTFTPDYIGGQNKVFARRNGSYMYFYDPTTIEKTAREIKSLNVSGVIVYPLEDDRLDTECGGPFPLFRAVNRGLGRLSDAVNGTDGSETHGRNNWTYYLFIPVAVIVIVALVSWKLLRRRRNDATKRMTPTVFSLDTRRVGEDGGTGKLGSSQKANDTSNRYQLWARGGIESGWRNDKPPDKGWEIQRGHLKMLEVIGQGCFGQVWKCEFSKLKGCKSSSIVAVKTVKEIANDRDRQELLNELEVMKHLGRHINVVSLIGCCTDRDPILVVLEYVSGGKLQTYLRDCRSEHNYYNLHGSSSCLVPRDLISFGYQAARGMEFLSSKGIIHRDLAARNILIDKTNKICKVADFGFARTVEEDLVYEKKSDGRLPIRWLAPENLFDNTYTSQSDVWSFGVLLWEIATLGMTPYPGLSASDVVKEIKNGKHLEKPEHCRYELYDLMSCCWALNPKERPSFTELVTKLDEILSEDLEYIDFFAFTGNIYYNDVPENSDEKV